MVKRIPKRPVCEVHSLRPSSRTRKQPLELLDSVPKRPKLSPSIQDLPPEMLLKIFSFLPSNEVFFQLSFVCQQWRNVIRDLIVWRKVILESSTPEECLPIWRTNLSQLKHLVVRDRKDVNAILEIVAQNCEHLKSLELFNCHGSLQRKLISSKVLCNVARTCKKLRYIRFNRTVFNSVKFLKCLAKNIKNNKINRGRYIGPITGTYLWRLWITMVQHQKQNMAQDVLDNIRRLRTSGFRIVKNGVCDLNFCIIRELANM